MMQSKPLSRTLTSVGLIAMLIGAVDPLEGSVIILLGSGLVTIGAHIGKSRFRKLLLGSFILVAVGVGVAWGLTAIGGIGGSSGHSAWWGLMVLPYPIGWLAGIVGAILRLREKEGQFATPDLAVGEKKPPIPNQE